MHQLIKANIVVDSLSSLSIVSVSYIENEEKQLVCDVHRLSHLGVHLIDLNDGGVVVQNRSESSPESDVKGKKKEILIWLS